MNRKSSALIWSLAFALSAVPAARAYDFCVGGVYYNYTSPDHKGAMVTYGDLSNNPYTGDIVVPKQVSYRMETMDVKGVGDHAFFNCQTVTSVTLPEGVTSIGQQAFSHCYAMKSVSLPQSLQRIEDAAFEYCEDMTSFTVPQGVTRIDCSGYGVFYQCRGLKEFSVEEGNVMFTAVDGVLYSSDMSMLVQYPASRAETEYVIPDEVVTMSATAFAPALVLEKLVIGSSLGMVEMAAFGECPALREFEVSADNEAMCAVGGVLFDKDVTTLVQYPAGSTVSDYALPGTVTSMADMSMAYSGNVTRLTLPESLESIGAYAMVECSGLQRVISLNPVPPTCSAMGVFDGTTFSTATLYVDASALDAYRRDAVWGKFATILAYDPAGIDDVGVAAGGAVVVNGSTVSTAAGGAVEVYDLAGRRVASGRGSVELPGPGMYVVRASGTAAKVVI